MKRTILKPFLWLTVLVGCSGLLTTTPQPVIAQVNSSVLLVQQSDELEEAERLEQQATELRQQGKFNKAIPIVERVLEIRERLLGENHLDTVESLHNLGLLYLAQERFNEVELVYKRFSTIKGRLLGENNLDIAEFVDNLLNTAESFHNIAGIFFAQGQFDEAESLYKSSVMIRLGLTRQNNLNVVDFLNNALDTAKSLDNLGTLYLAQKRYDEAETLYKLSLTIREKYSGENGENGENHSDTAKSFNNLGTLYLAQERYDEAEPLFQRSLAIREKVLGENHSDTAESLNYLALLYFVQERYDEAEPLFQRSLAIREKVLGENHSDTTESLNYLAKLYRSQGRYDEAESLIQRIQSIQNPASK